tara:strand:- start:139 stop:558 length:420 start_codon:yes stop_codon:yes gene_type:complete
MDFTLESALLFISTKKLKTKEDFKNQKEAQKVIKESNLSNKEINQIRKKVLAEDKADKKIIKYQQMPSKQKDMVDNIGKMGIGAKPKMAYGGSIKGKKHFYSNGGSVKDNAGLIALGKQSPSTYKKITGREFKNEYKGP